MLTIFATPKPFVGHDGMIQKNAIGSWVRLHPECEVLLFGEEPGAAELAQELRIQHIRDVRHSEFGTKRLDHIFARAQEIARHDLLCFSNCDIIFFQSFYEAVTRVSTRFPQFLMVGRRCDAPLTHAVDFQAADWEFQLRDFAMRRGKLQPHYAVDYFAFSRGLYAAIPPFAVGRVYWDHWLVWKARSMRVPVVDASADVLAIHQAHDYAYHSGGLCGIKTDVESKRNRKLAGGQMHLYTIDHATHRLIGGGLEKKPGRWHVPISALIVTYSSQLWYWLLKGTFKLRSGLGLRRGFLAQVMRRAHR